MTIIYQSALEIGETIESVLVQRKAMMLQKIMASGVKP